MILAFNRQFVEKILNGQKVHTIRQDNHNRWKPGNKIHFATGVRTDKYNQFASGYCKSINGIFIDSKNKIIMIGNDQAGWKILDHDSALKLMQSDGFDSPDKFWQWFNKPFEGKLIWFTNVQPTQ